MPRLRRSSGSSTKGSTARATWRVPKLLRRRCLRADGWRGDARLPVLLGRDNLQPPARVRRSAEVSDHPARSGPPLLVALPAQPRPRLGVALLRGRASRRARALFFVEHPQLLRHRTLRRADPEVVFSVSPLALSRDVSGGLGRRRGVSFAGHLPVSGRTIHGRPDSPRPAAQLCVDPAQRVRSRRGRPLDRQAPSRTMELADPRDRQAPE
jgi:hypothetical protein